MPRVIHFEFLAEDPERAIAFWSDVFGWQIPNGPGQTYWPATTGEAPPGINGGIMRRSDFVAASGGDAPAGGAVCTVRVTALEDTLAAVSEHGGRVLVAAREVPGVGRVAYCADPEGTIFAVLEPA